MTSRFKFFSSFCAVLWLAGLAGPSLSADSQDIVERIKPVGDLCMAGENCAAAVTVAASGGASRTGEDIYNATCATCHATGATGAPKLGDVAAWSPRIDKGIEALYLSAIKGFNGMPAKGLCFDCSDEEIKATVDYMVQGSK